MRPRLLDLFCGAGGAASGYHEAGFDVVGIDIKPQPRYPFEFIQADCLTLDPALLASFDAIHASPPCQKHTAAAPLQGKEHTDLIPATRAMLREAGLPYVIENVPGAPLISPVTICGLALGLNVKRHRLFESNELLFGTECPKGHPGDWLIVFGYSALRRSRGQGTGPKKDRGKSKGKSAPHEEACAAMGIEWMTRMELSQAIPPAYTKYIGKQILAHIQADSGRCPECEGAGWVAGVDYESRCCGGSDYECGGRGCSGPIQEQVQVQEGCACCQGTGQVGAQPLVERCKHCGRGPYDTLSIINGVCMECSVASADSQTPGGPPMTKTISLKALAERIEKARDKGEIDGLCRELHEIDEHSNVNGSCAAYLYSLQDAKRLIPEGRGYLLACDENRCWGKVVKMGDDAVEGFSAIRPGAFAETRALCAAALRARDSQANRQEAV